MLHNPKAQNTARLTILLYLAVLATLLATTFYPTPVEGVSIPLILAVKLLPFLPLRYRYSVATTAATSGWRL